MIDLDDELLAEVGKALGTSTKKDTVDSALREVLETRLRAMVADVAVDVSIFEDERNYRR